jgi:hypothetical protein
MIFTINSQEDSWLEKKYDEAMAVLGQFFGINWVENKPKVFVLPDRKTIDKIKGKSTARWVVGFGGLGTGGIYLLDRTNFEKESDNTYSDERYAALLEHELSHCFMDILTKNYRKPLWLVEGLAIYLSGQLQWYKKPEKLEKFLESFDKQGEKIYSESGFAVNFLIEKYGKDKIIELLKQLSNRPDENKFNEIFKSIFGVELSYASFSG